MTQAPLPQRQARPLTERQAELVRFVAAYQARHGYPPTIREIATALGLSSTNGPKEHLDRLQAKGWLRYTPRRPRSIQLLRTLEGDPLELPPREPAEVLAQAVEEAIEVLAGQSAPADPEERAALLLVAARRMRDQRDQLQRERDTYLARLRKRNPADAPKVHTFSIEASRVTGGASRRAE